MIKPHLKAGDALAALQKRSKNIVTKGLGNEDIIDGAMPPNLQGFISPMLEQVQSFKVQKASGDLVILPALHSLSDAKLDLLVEILTKKSGGVTEEKIVQMAYIVLDDLKSLDDAIPHIKTTKAEILKFFVELYSSEYHTYKAGTAIYNNEEFMSDVKGIIKFRQGATSAAVPSQGGCILA